MTYEKFSELIKKADERTRFLSGGHHNNEQVRQIIKEADENTITYTCLFLEEYTHLAFAILYELVPSINHPPIPEYYCGRIPVILECWKYWALVNKLVSTKYDPKAYWVEDKFGHRGDWH